MNPPPLDPHNPLTPGDDAIIVDVETTGLDPRTDRIVSIATCRIEAGRLAACFESLVHPEGKASSDDAFAVHRISPESLLHAPSFESIWPRIEAEAKHLLPVAHNAAFDASFLAAALARIGRNAHPLATVANWTCTLTLSRHAFATGARHGLDALAQHLGLRGRAKGDHHRAGVDAALLAQCWLQWRGAESQGDLFTGSQTDPKSLAPVIAVPLTEHDIEAHRIWCEHAGYDPLHNDHTLVTTPSNAS